MKEISKINLFGGNVGGVPYARHKSARGKHAGSVARASPKPGVVGASRELRAWVWSRVVRMSVLVDMEAFTHRFQNVPDADELGLKNDQISF